MSDHDKWNRCPLCGGAKRKEGGLCHACVTNQPKRRIPFADYVCEYAEELMARGFYAHRQMCTDCPDTWKMPADCEDWECETCDRECCCHTPPTPERKAAHDKYWATHVIVPRMPEKDGDGGEPRVRPRQSHPCAMCGKPVINKENRLCKSCAAKERERIRREQRELDKEEGL